MRGEVYTYCHVGSRAHKGVGHGVNELTTDTEITQLDLTLRVDQDIGWFHI